MNRADFSLPNFCRLSWTSEAARAHWAPIFQEITQASSAIEVESVVQGIRQLALHSVERARAGEFLEWCRKRGLEASALYSHGRSQYISEMGHRAAGGDLTVYAVGRKDAVVAGEGAFRTGQNRALGDLLGYPKCCQDFFEDVWVGQRHIDTSWPMSMRSDGEELDDGRTRSHAVAPHTNLLLRWLGVRPVFHLPCSFHCDASERVSRGLLVLAQVTGHGHAFARLNEALGWSVQWSALHGIAEIETPVCKVAARTDATRTKYTVRLVGQSEVESAPVGNRFPYRRTRPATVMTLRPHRLPIPTSERTHLDFGFSSARDLRDAVWPLLKAVLSQGDGSLMHVACKNGALLAESKRYSPHTSLIGSEFDAVRVEQARLLVPAAQILKGAYTDTAFIDSLPAAHVCLIAVGRLLEPPVDVATSMVRALLRKCRWLCVYAFSDWIAQLEGSDLQQRLGGLIAELVKCSDGSSVLRLSGNRAESDALAQTA